MHLTEKWLFYLTCSISRNVLKYDLPWSLISWKFFTELVDLFDMAEPEQIERFKKYVEDKGYDYYSICAPIMEGTKELMNAVWNKLQTLPPIKEYEVEEIPLEAIVKDDKGFKISQPEEHYFLVEASWFPKVLKGIDIEDYEALQYMQRVLEKSGIFDA